MSQLVLSVIFFSVSWFDNEPTSLLLDLQMNPGCFAGENLVVWYEAGDADAHVWDDRSWWVCKKLGLWIWTAILSFLWYVRQGVKGWFKPLLRGSITERAR